MLEKQFDKYVSNYNMSNEIIKLKYNHSYRVMELSGKIAKQLNYDKEDIELAKIIGLLHDIGRFEQIKLYNTIQDSKSLDHAEYGVFELFNKKKIEQFTTRANDYNLIKFAIENHNKYQIQPCKDKRILKFANLIRDVDKIDIIYLLGTLKETNIKPTNEPISKEVVNCVKNHCSVPYNLIKNQNDEIVSKFCYVYDIYNDICIPIMKENIFRFYKHVEHNDTFKEIYEMINNYLDERIDQYARKKI